MVYIYKKIVGKKAYYYLRASVKRKNKLITKDIMYLGDDINTVKDKLKKIPSKYYNDIKKAYRTINRFIETNIYLEKIKGLKLKKDSYLSKEALEYIESCKLHWDNQFYKLDELTKKEILKNFIIEFAFNTASLEGNTITLKQAQDLLIENITPKDKSLREVYDLQNTEKVFFRLFDELNKVNKDINHEFICEIHDSLMNNIDVRKGYRTIDVRVFRANFESTPAPYVKADMELLLKWYKENEHKLHPFALAIIFHHKFEKIHPFMDGNGRTGRMLLNLILLKKGNPPLIIKKKNRIMYLNKLNKADKCKITTSTAAYYSDLIDFCAFEMYNSYWNLFL